MSRKPSVGPRARREPLKPRSGAGEIGTKFMSSQTSGTTTTFPTGRVMTAGETRRPATNGKERNNPSSVAARGTPGLNEPVSSAAARRAKQSRLAAAGEDLHSPVKHRSTNSKGSTITSTLTESVRPSTRKQPQVPPTTERARPQTAGLGRRSEEKVSPKKPLPSREEVRRGLSEKSEARAVTPTHKRSPATEVGVKHKATLNGEQKVDTRGMKTKSEGQDLKAKETRSHVQELKTRSEALGMKTKETRSEIPEVKVKENVSEVQEMKPQPKTQEPVVHEQEKTIPEPPVKEPASKFEMEWFVNCPIPVELFMKCMVTLQGEVIDMESRINTKICAVHRKIADLEALVASLSNK